jgi:23S rRNA (guanosine2251-2'-O)-methyltransferase
MQKEESKFASSRIFEGMTSIRALIKSIDSGLSDRRLEKIIFDKARLKKIAKEIGYFKAVSEKYGFIIEEADASTLDGMTIGSSHGGIIAVASERHFPSLSELTPKKNGFYVMIEGVEDPYNFGYSLRSLYAMGCDGIILGERNWMSAAGVVARSSAGASELSSLYQSDPLSAVQFFKNHGYTVVCADENTDNVLGKLELKLPIFLIVGGEKRGISAAVLKEADILVKINYAREFNASLSAASATTMFAYEINRLNCK